MGEQKTPDPSQNQGGNQSDRQFPEQNQQPSEQASTPSMEGDAARRQSRQDPLQNRGR